MTERAVAVCLIIAGALMLASGAASQSRAYTIAVGRINPTEQESQECVFPIGQATSLLLHPHGEPCVMLRELIGRTGTLVFIPD